MASVLAIGSLIGGKIASAFSGTSLLGLGLGALGAVSQIAAGNAQASTSFQQASGFLDQSEAQNRQLQLQLEQDRAQQAIEAEARARRVRSDLATINATFGSSNVGLSGTPSVLAGETISEFDRQTRQGNIFSGLNQSQIRLQQSNILNTASNRAQDAISRGSFQRRQGLIGGFSSLLTPLVRGGLRGSA
jgi:hypothetical protein